jgi:subtilase family serine protease
MVFFVKPRNEEKFRKLESIRTRLTKEYLRENYFPSNQDALIVKQWLRNQGFTIFREEENNWYFSAKGTVAQFAKVFDAKFCEIRAGDDPKTWVAPCTMPSLPAEIFQRVNYISDLTPYKSLDLRVEIEVINLNVPNN